MSNYEWTCQNCEKPNPSDLEECASCGCPAKISALELKEWKSGQNKIPQKPSLMGYTFWGIWYWFYNKLAPCPHCSLLMNVKYRECQHCGYKLSELQHQIQVMYDKSERAVGLKLGFLWTPIIFLAMVAIFWVIQH